MKILLIIVTLFLTACVSLPENIQPVSNFSVEKYVGKWYEIARLDHRFERGLSKISADYSLRDDGGVKVINRGYSVAEQKWQQAEGKAYFVEEPTQGFLKVSFFGPFYSSYVVFELDHDNYQYALVCSFDKSYFWILARDKTISTELKNKLVAKAASLGFDTSKLIYVNQD